MAKEIRANAPKDTGDYSESWVVKRVRKTFSSLPAGTSFGIWSAKRNGKDRITLARELPVGPG